jgi:hypothetical protein
MNTDTPQVEQWLKDLTEAKYPYHNGASQRAKGVIDRRRNYFIEDVQWAMANPGVINNEDWLQNQEGELKKKAKALVKKIEGAQFTRGRRDVLIMYDEIAPYVNDLKYFL